MVYSRLPRLTWLLLTRRVSRSEYQLGLTRPNKLAVFLRSGGLAACDRHPFQ